MGATWGREKAPGCCILGTEAGLTTPPPPFPFPPPPDTIWPAAPAPLPGELGSVEQQLAGPPPPLLIPDESIGDSTDMGEAGNCR